VKNTTIARNYAEALFLAAARHRSPALEQYGQLLDGVAGAVQTDERIAIVLESPRVAKATKAQLLADALGDVAPKEVVRFLQAVVRRGRQGLLTDIAREYQTLLDVKLHRVHAGITLAMEPDARLERHIVERLTHALGREVRAHFRTDRGILGGVVVRVGDRVFDGSLKRRAAALRRQLLAGE
jgi:F-type H+-transporting ATPase subunit delta